MYRIFLLFILIIFSCGNKEQLLDSLKADLPVLNKLKTLTENTFIKPGKYNSSMRIMLKDCAQDSRIMKQEVCVSEDMLNLMRSLQITEINVEANDCDSIRKFNKIYFWTSKGSKIKSIFYLYNYCDEVIDFESDKYYQKSVDKNWSLVIDSTFP